MRSNWKVSAALLVWLAAAAAGAEDPVARELMEKVVGNYRSVQHERERLSLVVLPNPDEAAYELANAKQIASSPPRGAVVKRGLRYLLYADDQKDKIQIRFSAPPEDAGTGFLVWREPGKGQDKQWIYLPAMKRVRRVPVSSTQTFVGTNLIYEDVRELAGERTERYVYQSAGDEEVDGRPCAVVVATPAEGADSAYSSRKQWVDRERLLPVRIEYYDKRGKLWKVLRNSSLELVLDGVYRPGLMVMRDLQVDEATLLWFDQREVGKAAPREVFSKDYLESAVE